MRRSGMWLTLVLAVVLAVSACSSHTLPPETTTLVTGLAAPWSVVPLTEGGALVSERDTARVLELTPDGRQRTVAQLPEVTPGGQGGLLGLAVAEAACTRTLFDYYTTDTDNRVVRWPLLGAAGALRLGPASTGRSCDTRPTVLCRPTISSPAICCSHWGTAIYRAWHGTAEAGCGPATSATTPGTN